MERIKVLSLFSGIGAFEKALTNIGIAYDLIGFSEIDKYAAKSYCAVHNIEDTLNLGDITKINIENLPKDIDLISHGSPCQDYSVAGNNGGGDKGSGTRSSLMWNTVEIVKHCGPKYIIWENVKNVLSKKHIHNFNKYISDLDDMGYTSYYEVLNAKDYGVPQNRERIFVISIRKDLNQTFTFPKGFELNLRLKDVLEKEVEEKYYLSQEIQDRFLQFSKDRLNNKDLEVVGTTAPNPYDKDGNIIYDKCTSAWVYNPNKCISTLAARDYKQPKQIIEVKPIRLGGVFDDYKGRHQAGSIWDKDQISPTLDTMQGGWRQPLITETSEEFNQFKIRKLTPLECWKLMGFSNADFYKAKSVPTSNTQLYKQAGNSIVVPIIERIFQNLLKNY